MRINSILRDAFSRNITTPFAAHSCAATVGPIGHPKPAAYETLTRSSLETAVDALSETPQ
jgi:hypothetical protein